MRQIIQFIWNHPLSSKNRLYGLWRFLWWQLLSRVKSDVVVTYGSESQLLVSRGMAGATGNIYTGLHEFREMAFFLHACRKQDVFLDVGANVGSFSVLIGNETECAIRAFEPVPKTYARLQENLTLNGIVPDSARNVGVGKVVGSLRFSSGLDTVNHVLLGDSDSSIEVPVVTIDDSMVEARYCFIKVDVEGFEMEVILGAKRTLENTMGLMVELNGSGESYGFSDNDVRSVLDSMGFIEVDYNPFTRGLVQQTSDSDNALFVKKELWNQLEKRLEGASRRTVFGVEF